MSWKKLVWPFLLQFFLRRKSPAETQSHQLLNMMVSTVKSAISEMVLKIVFALVATGVLIYSLIVIGRHVDTYMQIYEKGPLLSILLFSLVSLLCVFGVIKMFKKEPTHFLDSLYEKRQTTPQAIHVDKLLSQFLEGLSSGIQQGHAEMKIKDETDFRSSDLAN